MSITFKFLFEESELVTVVSFSDLTIDKLLDVEATTESLFIILFPLEDSIVLSLVILFVLSVALRWWAVFDSSLLILPPAITVLLFPVFSSCALAAPPKKINEPIATDAIPKLNFFIPYFTNFLSTLFLNIFPPGFYLKYMYLNFN